MKSITANLPLLLLASTMDVMTGCKIQAEPRTIAIIFENDVHCAIDGYPLLAGLRDEVADTACTQLVSCGDFIQGGVIGSLTKGKAIIDIMKAMHYDVLTIGNHEFDYKCDHLFGLMDELGAPVTCCNFVDYATRQSVYPSFLMTEVGGRKIAYVGVTTPTTMSTMPTAFCDEDGKPVYDLCIEDVFAPVQQAVDQARGEGADYVIVLSHLGEEENDIHITSQAMVASTNGIDVVLDAHSHNVMPQYMVDNKDGKAVPVAQTGTKFSHIGKLVILPDGELSITLLEVAGLCKRNESVQAAVDRVKAEVDTITARLICKNDIALPLESEDGFEFGRVCECAAGNLVTDAFRAVLGTQIGLLDASSIRNGLKQGDLTYGDIMAFLPYDSQLCEVEVTGEEILQMLRANTILIPQPDGQFPMVSGLRYTVDAISHVVSDVQVLDAETGSYQPIVKDRTYTLASTDYTIFGGGLRSTLVNARPVRKGVINYCGAFIDYVSNVLSGHITQQNCHLDDRITVTNLEQALKRINSQANINK